MSKVKFSGVSFTWNSVAIDYLTNISFTSSKGKIDVTGFDSTGNWEEWLHGAKNLEISFTAWMDGAATSGFDELQADYTADTNRAFILAGDTSGDVQISGTGGITSIGGGVGQGDAMSYDITVEATGAPTIGNVA